MTEEYKKAVLEFYKQKKNEHSLPSRLNELTPGNFREACIYVYRNRKSSSDDEVIKSFFSDIDPEKGCLKMLESSLAVKFKQMVNIMEGRVVNPGIVYIELLAWVLDFQPRPSAAFYKQQINLVSPIDSTVGNKEREELNNADKIHGEVVNTENVKFTITEIINTPPPPVKSRLKKLMNDLSKFKLKIFLLIIFVLAFVGISMLFTKKNEQCMYWTGTEYQQVSCSTANGTNTVVALDARKLAALKKIERPDTMTMNSIHKVWYVKVSTDSIEFYTDRGEYPLNNQKRLLPITPFILKKYVLNK